MMIVRLKILTIALVFLMNLKLLHVTAVKNFCQNLVKEFAAISVSAGNVLSVHI